MMGLSLYSAELSSRRSLLMGDRQPSLKLELYEWAPRKFVLNLG